MGRFKTEEMRYKKKMLKKAKLRAELQRKSLEEARTLLKEIAQEHAAEAGLLNKEARNVRG